MVRGRGGILQRIEKEPKGAFLLGATLQLEQQPLGGHGFRRGSGVKLLGQRVGAPFQDIEGCVVDRGGDQRLWRLAGRRLGSGCGHGKNCRKNRANRTQHE